MAEFGTNWINFFNWALARVFVFLQKNFGEKKLKGLIDDFLAKSQFPQAVFQNGVIDFSAYSQASSGELINFFRKLFVVLIGVITESFGEKIAVNLVQDVYGEIVEKFPDQQSVFLEVVPVEFLQKERLTVFNREQLEARVLEATKAEQEKLKLSQSLQGELEKKIFESERANRELSDTKTAMLNLLEDLDAEKKKVEETVQIRTRELREEQARLVASINSLSLGFTIVDINENILITNPAMRQIMNLPEDFKLNELASHLAPAFDLSANCRKCIAETKSVEVRDVTVGGKFFRIFISPITIIRDHGEVIGAAILLEDVTAAKLLERSKDEFFAVASHELRTPLTSIRGNMAMIKEYFLPEIKNKDLAEMVNDAYEAAVRLIKIVNDFLDVSRLEQQKATFKNEKVDLVKVVYDLVKNYESTALSKGISLVLEDQNGRYPEVLTDQSRVIQVVSNLIDNAIKYTQKGSVTVSLKEEGGLLAVYIRDTGVGISNTNQGLLFKKFQQAGENMLARDVTQSTGLGLYITKLIIEEMGGEVGLVKSELGKGSIFRVALPIAGESNIK